MSSYDFKETVKARMEKGLTGTLALSTWLTSAFLRASEKEKLELWAMIDAAIAYYGSILKTVPDGPERVAIMHSLMEAQGAPDGHRCQKGCHFCCKMEVTAFDEEWKRLGEPPREGKSGYCAFLTTTGVCSVYDKRPAMCRLHFVASEPGLCAGDEEETQRIVQMLPELILAAYLEVSPSAEATTTLPKRTT